MKILFSITLCLAVSTINASPAIEAFEEKDYPKAKILFSKTSEQTQAKFYLARIAFIEGELDKAEELMQQALANQDSNSDYHYWFARINARQASNASVFSAPGYASAAREHFQYALKLDPENILAMRGLINFYTQAPAIAGGSYKKAIAMTKQLEKISPELALISLIDIYREQENTEKELAVAKNLIDKFPNSARALTKAGFSFQLTEEYDLAFKLFIQSSKIVDKEQTNSVHSALYQIGRTADLSNKNTQQGVQALEQYLQLQTNSELPSKEWAKYRLASLYSKLGKSEQAEQLINEVIESSDETRLKRRAKHLLKTL